MAVQESTLISVFTMFEERLALLERASQLQTNAAIFRERRTVGLVNPGVFGWDFDVRRHPERPKESETGRTDNLRPTCVFVYRNPPVQNKSIDSTWFWPEVESSDVPVNLLAHGFDSATIERIRVTLKQRVEADDDDLTLLCEDYGIPSVYQEIYQEMTHRVLERCKGDLVDRAEEDQWGDMGLWLWDARGKTIDEWVDAYRTLATRVGMWGPADKTTLVDVYPAKPLLAEAACVTGCSCPYKPSERELSAVLGPLQKLPGFAQGRWQDDSWKTYCKDHPILQNFIDPFEAARDARL